MENSRIYTIDEKECLGDSLTFINTNFKILDILACNLKANTLDFVNNSTLVQDNSAYIDEAFDYLLQQNNSFNTAYNIVKELGKYWNGYQFTVYAKPHYFSPHLVNIAEIIRISILNVDYTPSNYPDYTIVNVIKTNYNKNPWPDPIPPATAINITPFSAIAPLKELSHSIYRYISIDNTWKFVESIVCADSEEPLPAISSSDVLILSAFRTENTSNIQKFNIVAKLSSSTTKTITNLSATDYFAWEGYLNDVNLQNVNISARSLTNSSLTSVLGVIHPITAISSIEISIDAGTFTETPEVSTFYVAGYDYTDRNLRKSLTSFDICGFPDRSVLDVYFTVEEFKGTKWYEIANSSLATYVLPSTATTLRFTPYIRTQPKTEDYQLVWVKDDYINPPVSSFGRIFNVAFGNNVRKTTLTLHALSVFSLEWGGYFNISRSIDIHQRPYFNTQVPVDLPPEFIIWPKQTWVYGDYVDLTPEYYKLASGPVAYANKKSATEQFYVSATSGYNYYCWSYANTTLETTSHVAILDIPYTTELASITGMPVTLTAYNAWYNKANNTVNYKRPLDFTGQYPIVASTTYGNPNVYKNNPKIIPYDKTTIYYDLNQFDFDLIKNNKIISTQMVYTEVDMSPVKPISGVVTYTMSNGYWTVNKTVPAINDVFELFCLTSGDPTVPYCVDAGNVTPLNITASAVLVSQIDPGDSSLWYPVSSQVIFAPVRPEFRNSPTPTITPSNTPTPTKTATNTPTPTKTPTITPTPTPILARACGSTIRNSGLGIFTYTMDVRNGMGDSKFRYNTFNIPDRFIVTLDGVDIIDTNFVGDMSYNADLAALGFGPVVAPGFGVIPFVKSTGADFLYVTVFAPLPDTVWEFSIDCFPRVTITPTTTMTPTPTIGPKSPTPTPTITPTHTPTNTPGLSPSKTPTNTVTPSPTPVTRELFCGDVEYRAGAGTYLYRIRYAGSSFVMIDYNTFNVPDRFTSLWNSVSTNTTGFVGDGSYNATLTALGYEEISGPGRGSITIPVRGGDLIYRVEAPLPNTEFFFKVRCF